MVILDGELVATAIDETTAEMTAVAISALLSAAVEASEAFLASKGTTIQ